jgi:ubiquinone/menaquinone biosynthesis C-methylase UbiE
VSRSGQPAPAAAGADVRLGAAERLCLLLAACGARILEVDAPLDLEDSASRDAHFERQVERSRSFGRAFSEPIDVVGKTVLEVGCGYGGMQRALLESGAARTIGLDVDAGAIELARANLAGEPRVSFVEGDIERCPLPSSSVDIVVSDAVLEHVGDIEAALGEVARVLRPGGRLYARFSPTWRTYNGAHLIKHLPIPWGHLLFSDRTILRVLHHYREQGRFPARSLDARIEDFERMGRLTRAKFRTAAAASGLRVVQEDSRSPSRLKERLGRLPFLDELLAGAIVAILEKPAPG